MLRADIELYGKRSPDEIYGGLISGYTSPLAAFVGHERLNNQGDVGGYYLGFYCFSSLSRDALYREVGRGKLTS